LLPKLYPAEPIGRLGCRWPFFVTLLTSPRISYWLFQIENATSSMSRHAPMLFLGLSAVILLTRPTTDFQTRRSSSFAIALSMSGLFILG
jgi:hypothetical protein